MDLENIDRASFAGVSLNIEEVSGLQVAMLQRLREERLVSKLKLWGKILGVERDYLITCSLMPTEAFPDKKFFYCTTSDYSLRQMPELDAPFEAMAAALDPIKRFTGDPSVLLDGKESDDPNEAEESQDEEGAAEQMLKKETERFREVHRLAYTVRMIEHDVAVTPQGAMIVDALHQIIPNASFKGLSFHTAIDLRAYFHFRRPENPQARAVLEKPGFVRTQDFLDPLSKDQPSGAWSLQYDASGSMVFLWNLYWEGYYFYHTIGTAEYGGVYIGLGLPNKDLAFML